MLSLVWDKGFILPNLYQSQDIIEKTNHLNRNGQINCSLNYLYLCCVKSQQQLPQGILFSKA